jgi:hypothetical protein
MRDLLDEQRAVYQAEQDRVATHGWGRRLLAHADDVGRWTPRIYGKKWISTTYSMLLLRQLGLPPGELAALRSGRLLLDEGLFEDGGIRVTFSQRRSETCVTGMVLGIVSWFGMADPRREQLLSYLLAEQLADGGWNCQRHRGSTHSSFHTTINVLEGLHEYASAAAAEAARAGREFLLRHRLFRSHRSGAVVDQRMTRLSFPPWWRYDVLRALDHFAAADAPNRREADRGRAAGRGQARLRRAVAVAGPAPRGDLVRDGAGRPTQQVDHVAGSSRAALVGGRKGLWRTGHRGGKVNALHRRRT